jgi:hypothetical protein
MLAGSQSERGAVCTSPEVELMETHLVWLNRV